MSKKVVLGSIIMAIYACFLFAKENFNPEDVFKTKYCTSAVISPNGEWVAYLVSFQREAQEEPGESYSNLYLVSTKTKEVKPFIVGKEIISSIKWNPNGKEIAFIMKRGEKDKKQIWSIRVDGGEAFKLSNSKSDVLFFQWHPSGNKIGYIATTPDSELEEKLAEKGYKFIYYEEDWKHQNLYLIQRDGEGNFTDPIQLTENITIWDFEFSPDGNIIAASASEKNLVDYNYMFRNIYLINPVNKKINKLTNNEGKLGNYKFSPNGSALVYTAAKNRADHSVSQVYVISINEGKEKNLTPLNFRGHIVWANWKDDKNIIYLANEGMWTTLRISPIDKIESQIILNSKDIGIVFSAPDYTKDFKHFAFIGSSAELPSDVFYWRGNGKFDKLTDLNPWIKEKRLGKQEIIRYKARDGKEIEGIIIYPVEYKNRERYPLIVIVHGGPEYNYSNRWLTNYFEPGQVLAGKGYLVFYPNYRSSTGYGLEFASAGYGDPAGKEFEDIIDGIIYLIKQGLVDKERVGLAGASYGGYAAAWFSTYYTEYIKAAVMFVGISDLISKMGTTDIPYEDLYVHLGKRLESAWDFYLERSPIYYAEKSKTAVLILGGTADTRVHPSQSIEFYRRLKMNNHPAVRLVQYPGEGHGNRKQPGRIDVLYRELQWFDWYIKDNKPIAGPMPPLDISKYYGLEQ